MSDYMSKRAADYGDEKLPYDEWRVAALIMNLDTGSSDLTQETLHNDVLLALLVIVRRLDRLTELVERATGSDDGEAQPEKPRYQGAV